MSFGQRGHATPLAVRGHPAALPPPQAIKPSSHCGGGAPGIRIPPPTGLWAMAAPGCPPHAGGSGGCEAGAAAPRPGHVAPKPPSQPGPGRASSPRGMRSPGEIPARLRSRPAAPAALASLSPSPSPGTGPRHPPGGAVMRGVGTPIPTLWGGCGVLGVPPPPCPYRGPAGKGLGIVAPSLACPGGVVGGCGWEQQIPQ